MCTVYILGMSPKNHLQYIVLSYCRLSYNWSLQTVAQTPNIRVAVCAHWGTTIIFLSPYTTAWLK